MGLTDHLSSEQVRLEFQQGMGQGQKEEQKFFMANDHNFNNDLEDTHFPNKSPWMTNPSDKYIIASQKRTPFETIKIFCDWLGLPTY